MADNKTIPFNFTYFAMKLLGKNLYSSPWTAVSEIVANGIDAGAENVYVMIDMRNKEKAVVEIFDDGSGMSFEDLKSKYALIGRNKRLDGENKKGKTLGRKGIGKLAALYLSPRYYIYTKTYSVTSTWEVNTQGILDSDVPALNQVDYNCSRLISKDIWNALKTGTMIHLSDVDLRKIGPERLKSLPVILADYYLDTVISANISVCVLDESNKKIEFQKIKKHINFDTMYGVFDNTGKGYKDRLKDKVYITKASADPAVDIPRPTIVLDESKFDCEGSINMTNLSGEMKTLPYKMIGWIGIHTSLDNSVLERNSKDGRRIVNHPNALRLYVRGKLAVNNLMPYVASTAAFAPYIEGEISFDVLDDDGFEDSSTSSREGYSATDPRIKKLVEIVGKIITSLVVKRNDVGNKINEELKAIKLQKEKEAEEAKKRKEEAEEEARREKERADQERREKEQAESERDYARAETASAHKRLFVLENNFTSSGEKYKHAMHLSVNFSKEIRSVVSDFVDGNLIASEETMSAIMDIDRSAEKIENLPQFVDAANFSLSSPNLRTGIVQLIRDYIEAKGNAKLQYSFDISYDVITEIDFTDILMLVENVIRNSIKANASRMCVKSEKIGEKLQIDFCDNGNGLAPKYVNNPQVIFNLGETTTPEGYGIGAFHMKEIAEKLGGGIEAIQAMPKGLIIRMVI